MQANINTEMRVPTLFKIVRSKTDICRPSNKSAQERSNGIIFLSVKHKKPIITFNSPRQLLTSTCILPMCLKQREVSLTRILPCFAMLCPAFPFKFSLLLSFSFLEKLLVFSYDTVVICNADLGNSCAKGNMFSVCFFQPSSTIYSMDSLSLLFSCSEKDTWTLDAC